MNKVLDKVGVQLAYLPVINFSIQQSKASVIHYLSIENQTETEIRNIKINLSAEPEFASINLIEIDQIGAKKSVRIDSFNIVLSSEFFSQLTERMTANFLLEVKSDDELIFKQSFPIDVLAYDQWSGISVLPEMLSAFITPNHPAISTILSRAGVILEKWTGSSALDEYQSRNPDRVRKQMAAIYTAISELNILYSTIPASFEEYGQRIRLADTVITQKLGTCLDMSLLYASCIEAIGIHPLIILTQGHAFAGGWLIPETFPDNTIDDVSYISKRTAEGIHDIVLVETTCMNHGKNTDFDQAVKIADTKLNPTDFILALDIKRCRFLGIRPLPQRVQKGNHWELKEDLCIPSAKNHIAPENIKPYDLSAISEDIVVTKQLLWERKLLDLSLRNNLLNIRITKNTLQLIPADIDRFEDALADGSEFSILHKPSDWNNPSYNFGLYQSIPESDPINELIKSELSQKRLRSYLSESDLSNVMTSLYRSSKMSIEENGANTLYLALGLLRWYETPTSERPRYAPVLLLPVEIIRKSAAKGYVVRSREEDAMMNITLLEMLRQNFNITIAGLDPLPADDSGINVKLIYSIIRNAIKDQKKWDVEEQAILGIFSFNKFIMWNDIHHNSNKLMQNDIVSSLVNGKIEWTVGEDMTDASELDKKLNPTDIVLPINADSSQMEAIFEAVNEKSFILHGPPGTGKSQTITNIIANALYRGKRVLFVAEKMAALSVVQSRLATIGLAPFCLELHSNKTKKTAIVGQLKTASEVVKTESPDNFRQEAERLLELRTKLNIYIEALHKKYPFGLSLYEAIVKYESIEGETISFPTSLLNDLNQEQRKIWEESIETLVSTANACGHPHSHPLSGIVITSYSATIKDEALQKLKEAEDCLTLLKTKINVFSELFGNNESGYDKKQIEVLSTIVQKLLQIPELTPALLKYPQLNEILDEYREIVVHGKNRDNIKATVENSFSEDVLSIDAKNLLNEWNRVSEKWFIPKYFGQKKVKKQLGLYSSNGKIENDNVKNLLNQIIKYKEENSFLEQYTDRNALLFGKFGKKGNEDWVSIEKIVEDTSVINSMILNYAKDINKTAKIKESISDQLSQGIAAFKSIHGNSLEEINDIIKKLSSIESQLTSTLGISKEFLYGQSNDWIDLSISKIKNWENNIDKLKDWYQWLLVYEKLNDLGIGFIADEYKNNNIPTDKILNIFHKSFSKASIDYIISKEPDLELFKGKIFNDTIDKYKKLCAEFDELTKKEVYAKLASNIPSFTREAAQNSEVGILQKNIKNNARGVSIRKLFDQIPTLLARMCPCMLMSPISVAQYINPDTEKFDLIIFDEASQMPTYEAVGAIARGKRVVIVGDPKQMPPTNFFSNNFIDEDNIDIEDLESILDDCLALSMPSKYLLWHYRSKHESLIAFSNSEYYENKLLTFPSPDNIESKVKLVSINGFYDKGKSRQNSAEAQAVVDEIARRLRDESLRKKSIGVVTFSSVQQSLIEDMLSDLFVFNPDLEKLALECEEPLFIKNLENVQGDERDVILFSIGYGPDSNGRVSMNFGPLNRVGGERRLNVAVSRARYEMIIYSTLRSEHIDLNRTSSVGVAGLKRFLEYSERGERIEINNQKEDNSTNTIENIIAKRLREDGYTVHTNIGCSGYKINIGIVDKNDPSKYVLGILCDGENYKRTKTTRDREIVQYSVLKSLGWNIHRVWTMDWWENQVEVMDSIKNALNRKDDSSIKINLSEKKENENQVLKKSYSETEPIKIKVSANDNSINKNQKGDTYIASPLESVSYLAEDFFLPKYIAIIKKQISDVIQKESPVSKNLVSKRVLTAWNIPRTSQRIEAHLNEIIKDIPHYHIECDDIIFLWKDENQYTSYNTYRTNSERDAIDLPPQEVANGMKEIIDNEISIPVKDLCRLTAHLFGFGRSGSNVEAAMQRGVAEALKKEYFKIENDKAIVL